jgi:hypothetical protein
MVQLPRRDSVRHFTGQLSLDSSYGLAIEFREEIGLSPISPFLAVLRKAGW